VTWDIPIGTVFAGYRITSVLGRGGMSIVYGAEHVRLGRMVALKLLSPALATDQSFQERFIRESQLAASLDHPNIIPIYDAGEAEGFLYIAMRHVDGPDLGAVLEKEGPLALGQALFYIEQVASALDQAHSQGLVHRDVKPANVLIARPADRVYLTDFGVVKQTSSGGLTKTGFFLGTFEYAAPEQIEGRHVDGRTDLYALGCVLYECLSGKPPYLADTEASVIHAHLVEPIPTLTDTRADLPRALNDVISTAMAKSIDDRYASCGELVRALRAAAMGSTVSGEGRAAPLPTVHAAAQGSASGGETILAGAAGAGGGPPVAAPPPPAPTSSEPAPAPTGDGGTPPSSGGRTVTFTARRLALIGGLLAAIIAGAVIAAVVLSGGDNNSKSSTGGTSGTANATGFAGVISNDVLKDCKKTSPELGAALTDTCEPTTTGGSNRPSSWKMSLFETDAEGLKAYNSMRQAADVGQNFGTCSGVDWGGEGSWLHNTTGTSTVRKPGGRRFCYFDGNVAVIVWLHEKLGQETHIPLLVAARRGGSDHTSLFSWFQFWHHRLGKCTDPNCVAKIK
jgi:Protein kinase domain